MSKIQKRFIPIYLMVWAIVSNAFICHAQIGPAMDQQGVDFTSFSLEELKDVEITSASKKPKKLSEIPAAVYVITKEDIRRSGATSIPELLRMATGVHVARSTVAEWAVNIRGLSGLYAQNLLVLIDGRSVYTHVFSGVFWDIQDTILEDIDRIEVVRGPGATLWGANAVNGVINIITKKTAETKGYQTIVIGGSEEQVVSLRYGSKLENDATYRVYGKVFNRGNLAGVIEDIENDYIDFNNKVQPKKEWRSGRMGFRIDSEVGRNMMDVPLNTFTLQGEAYRSRYEKDVLKQIHAPPWTTIESSDTSEPTGGHLLGRWRRALSYDSEAVMQVYLDHCQREYDFSQGKVSTADVDFQHRFKHQKHELIWGVAYRFISDEFDDRDNARSHPEYLNQHILSTFIQDEILILPDTLSLIIGSKFEYNAPADPEIQPSIRLIYLPHHNHAFWAAVSRAVRIPSRLEHDIEKVDRVDIIPPLNEGERSEVITLGNDDLKSEKLTAYEVGYRLLLFSQLQLNTTAFYNDYDELIGLDHNNNPQSGAEGTYELSYENSLHATAYGVELDANWQATDSWLLKATYTHLMTDVSDSPLRPEFREYKPERSNPQNLFSIRSAWDVTSDVDFDLWFRFVGRLPEKDIDSYTTLDARIAWRFSKSLELSLVGQNLFERGHEEYSALEVERSIYGKIDWHF